MHLMQLTAVRLRPVTRDTLSYNDYNRATAVIENRKDQWHQQIKMVSAQTWAGAVFEIAKQVDASFAGLFDGRVGLEHLEMTVTHQDLGDGTTLFWYPMKSVNGGQYFTSDELMSWKP